ncbi:MAG: ABC transporter permease [Oscillospiraceae bacterium]|nr:ABC transporter permease [Oscillospiraceae bacterium]
MGKFVNLVKNEYIKLMLKASTWVMLIILLIASVGLSAMALIGQKQYESYSVSETEDLIENYQSEINYLKDVKTEGWEQEVEYNQYLIDNAIENDWRINAAGTMFEIKYHAAEYGIADAEQLVSSIDNAIKNMDWKTYFQTAIELSEKVPVLIDNSDGTITLYQYCLDNSVAPYDKNWKYSVALQLESAKSQLKVFEEQRASGQQVDTEEMETLEENIKKYEYRLENNIEFDISENNNWTDGVFNFWSVFSTSSMLVSFIGVIVIIAAGGIVSGEFSTGTIKFLMINPVKRWKILTSKYFTAITFGYLAMIAAYIISILSTMIFFGADHLGASFTEVSGNTVKEIPGFLYVAQLYLLNSVNFIVMGSLAFAISSLFRSSALAIGISVMALFGGNTITLILSQLQFDWARYLIFSNLDISSIAEGNSMFAGQTVTGALAVIAVHMVIFLLTAWDGFNKREI